MTAHLVILKISSSSAALVITSLSCFLIMSWKGGCDGLGGTIKQLATRAIISRRAVIKDAKSLVEAVSQQTHIHLKLMSEDEI